MLATMSNVSGRMVVVIVVAIVFTAVGGGGNDRTTRWFKFFHSSMGKRHSNMGN